MAKGKKQFKIETPRGTVYTQASKGGRVTARLEWNEGFAPDKEKGFANAQEFVDSECIRWMNPETPRRTGVLIKSATLGTVIGSGEINQIAPYARRQYYEHKEKSYWFERMKNRHKESILKGAAKYVQSH
ncbi:minor capsid protein [Agathobacter rectalis]|uniref:hypothetical protein n=1 Tax=Agathobacter rectalis TaxID=39491 RepID=UPI0021FEBAD2|nr:hypothetical protein [Agathobacter rectalis]UTB43645.1 minor capsid protein [Agathobacter rectalis]